MRPLDAPPAAAQQAIAASLALQAEIAAAPSGAATACPLCVVPVPVACFGGHTSRALPCHAAAPFCCGSACGRPLACGNHVCARDCHALAADGSGCDACSGKCEKERLPGCTHACPQSCHPGPCNRYVLLLLQCHRVLMVQPITRCLAVLLHRASHPLACAGMPSGLLQGYQTNEIALSILTQRFQNTLAARSLSCRTMTWHPLNFLLHVVDCRCDVPVRQLCYCRKTSLSFACHELLGARDADAAAGDGCIAALACDKLCHKELPSCPHTCRFVVSARIATPAYAVMHLGQSC